MVQQGVVEGRSSQPGHLDWCCRIQGIFFCLQSSEGATNPPEVCHGIERCGRVMVQTGIS